MTITKRVAGHLAATRRVRSKVRGMPGGGQDVFKSRYHYHEASATDVLPVSDVLKKSILSLPLAEGRFMPCVRLACMMLNCIQGWAVSGRVVQYIQILTRYARCFYSSGSFDLPHMPAGRGGRKTRESEAMRVHMLDMVSPSANGEKLASGWGKENKMRSK